MTRNMDMTDTTGTSLTPTQCEGVSLAQALRQGTATLRQAGVPSPVADAELLAAHLLGTDAEGNRRGTAREGYTRGAVQQRALLGDALTAQDTQRYESLIARRARRIPLQHITGVAAFHRIQVRVGPGVFVPRPETELLVEEALNALQAYPQRRLRVVDLCAGSGAIAIAIKNALPNDALVTAVELSEHAEPWTRINCETYGVNFVHGDALSALEGLGGYFDAVVSNPPYIPQGRVPAEPEAAQHDPDMALYGGSADGMRIPAAVAARAAYLVKPGGFFIMEHDETQQDAVAEVFNELGFVRVRCVHDLTGRPRHTCGYRPTV